MAAAAPNSTLAELNMIHSLFNKAAALSPPRNQHAA
jgi:hypothetical protein